MTPSPRCLTPAQASAALGVSAKALRLYEQHGLLAPDRTRTGWRCYDAAALARALAEQAPLSVGFALPWPWDGEWFALDDLPRLSFVTGPLGSGKTRFARRLAEALPGAAFLGLDRLRDASAACRLAGDAALADRVARRLAWLVEEGATRSDALTALVVALDAAGPASLVIDAVEEGLDAATQAALMAHLRLRGTDLRALVLMTRSSSILDLEALEASELVILCPANHSTPLLAVPHPGGRGYEAVATCLAPPEVRARTAGIVALRPA